MMENPKKIALPCSVFFEPSFFIKKLTVIGIIGKTQGVRMAANPARNAPKKNASSDLPCSLVDSAAFTSSSVNAARTIIRIKEKGIGRLKKRTRYIICAMNTKGIVITVIRIREKYQYLVEIRAPR